MAVGSLWKILFRDDLRDSWPSLLSCWLKIPFLCNVCLSLRQPSTGQGETGEGREREKEKEGEKRREWDGGEEERGEEGGEGKGEGERE